MTWAYRGRLPRWFLSTSVIIDILLLMGLIWSFHLQYQQPPAFYLKAPTLLYVFIFIALRALTFSTRYVLLTGAAAAFGWLAMVLYAAFGTAENVVTRDYVEHMTSASVLLGAEFDKVISIALVTLILALVIVRARRLLVRSVSEGAAAESLSRFFDPDVARRIRGAEHEISAGIGEVREAAILFCDVRGFTNIASALRPDAVMRLLSEYQTRMDAVIERSGGSIDKFLGDGIMATFGAVSPNERFAADALRAMIELCTVADGWNAERAAAGEVPLDIRFSVATGAVVVGAVGDGTRLEYTVLGAPVNLAAKLEKHTKVEGRSGPNDRRWSGHGGASGLSPAGGNRATIGTVH